MGAEMLIKSLAPLVFITLLLSGCVSDNSINRHATDLIAQYRGLQSEPEMSINTADSIKGASQFLQPFYDLGKVDRDRGLSPEQAQRRVESFTGLPMFKAAAQQESFNNQSYSTQHPEQKAALALSAATEIYMDGYNGKP